MMQEEEEEEGDFSPEDRGVSASAPPPGPIITIRYDGGDADKHAIDMRLLGESLIGLDRIISDGLITIINQRLPKRGERAPLVLKAKEPVQGSVEIQAFLQEIGGLLALGMPLITTIGADLIWDWTKGTIYWFSGRRDLSDLALNALVDTHQRYLASRDASDERQHQERMAMLALLREAMSKLGPAAADAAAPVGNSVNQLEIAANDREPVTIDVPTADAMREHGVIEWGDLQTLRLKTDGFTFHNGKLSVENPDRAGYLLADVVDPVFAQESNPYAQAAQKKALIVVQGKLGYRGDRLEKISIADFGGEIDHVA